MIPNQERLAYLVHDIQSATTSVSLMVGLLELSAAAENQVEQTVRAKSALEACKQIAQLCSDIASQLDGTESLDHERKIFDVGELIDELDTVYSPIYELSGRTLACDLEDREFECIGNRSLIFRAITNLLDNGLKHTTKSSVVTVDISVRGDEVTVLVSDNGPGIRGVTTGFEQDLGLFVSREYPAGESIGIFSQGTGLRFVATAIQSQHGRASVSRNAFGGTTIKVTLPLV